MDVGKNDTQSQKPPLGVFLASTIVIFFLTLSAADSVDFVPYYIDDSQSGTSTTASSHSVYTEASGFVSSPPVRISIPSVGIDLPVQNPATRDIEALDAVLQSGPARYVDSALPGEKGNVLIFAHSSHLPIVHNQMFRAFNRISDLMPGDIITIEGDDGRSYYYGVENVRKADATDAIIDLSPTQGSKLTLVTCDTLTSKSSRFIVVANLVGVL